MKTVNYRRWLNILSGRKKIESSFKIMTHALRIRQYNSFFHHRISMHCMTVVTRRVLNLSEVEFVGYRLNAPSCLGIHRYAFIHNCLPKML